MTTLPASSDQQRDHTPFPLCIAKHFNFPLAYHERGDDIYYCIQDWIRGLTGAKNVRSTLNSIKNEDLSASLSRIQKLPYLTANKKLQKRDFTTAENLIRIMFRLRGFSSRPRIPEVRKLFCERLSQVSQANISSQSRKTFFDSDIDQLDLDVEDWVNDDFLHYGMSTQEKKFYEDYFKSKLYTSHLLEGFIGRTKDKIKPQYYDIITTDIYKGLWKRTPQQLKIQIGAPNVSCLKMYMPSLARSYHDTVYEVVRYDLADKEVWWYEIRHSVQHTVSVMGKMAEAMSEHLQIDVATGRPLLKA